MGRVQDPNFVVARKGGGFDVQVPVEHPPKCICKPCKRPGNRPPGTEEGKFVIRTRRKSPHPNHSDSVAFAKNLKRDLEAELKWNVEDAGRRKEALGKAVSVKKVCDYYEKWQLAQGKDWKRDRYRVKVIREFLGDNRDASSVAYEDYLNLCEHLKTKPIGPTQGPKKGKKSAASPKAKKKGTKRECSQATIRRYVNTFLAIFNRAVKARVLTAHQLANIERPKVVTNKKPMIFTNRQVAVLLGSAMDVYERSQAAAHQSYDPETKRRKPSVVPLRGLCMIAYTTLMRPETNFELRWEQLKFDPSGDRGRFRLDHHKNASKGVEVDAPLKPELVRYLKTIMPSRKARGLVHPNPDTGLAFVNIRKQWEQLVKIANNILDPDEQLTEVREHFYTWRHTGASHLAASSRDPVLVMRMMGDTQLQTVMKHYFDSDFEHMQTEVEKWTLPVEKLAAERTQARFESAIESDPN